MALRVEKRFFRREAERNFLCALCAFAVKKRITNNGNYEL
jgi:hypothetical protein